MGLRRWWAKQRETAALTRQSLAWNDDPELIAEQVPELTGMSDVEGMAYTLEQMRQWNLTCSRAEAAALANRLAASNEAFEADGLTMPYWGNLWVLRALQAKLGYDVPAVAARVDESDDG